MDYCPICGAEMTVEHRTQHDEGVPDVDHEVLRCPNECEETI